MFQYQSLDVNLIPGKSVNFDKNFEGKMEGYLEIFGRKFCGKKGNFGLWIRKLFLGSGNTGLTTDFVYFARR